MDKAGVDADGYRAISPLFTVDKNKNTRFIGTTFFIARQGLMLTAKHCLFDKNNKPFQTLFIVQFTEDKSYAIRPIFRSYWNNSDIAALLPNHMIDKRTGKDVFNPVNTITNAKPERGEVIVSFAYPKTKVNNIGSITGLDVGKTWHFGEIEEFHNEGTPFLKNSCFQTCMPIQPGSSGGPVFNSKGKIFAINSTGSDVSEDLEPYSFLTPIEHCLNLKIDGVHGEKFTIKELILANQIPFEGGFAY